MKFVQLVDALPRTQTNCLAFGRRKSGEVLQFGSGKRPSLGERLLGVYDEFYTVDLGAQEETRTFSARSSSGRFAFSIDLTVEVRVDEGEAKRLTPSDHGAIEAIFRTLKRSATRKAEHYDIREYQLLQDDLRAIFETERPPEESLGLVIINVDAVISPPKEVSLASEQVVNLQEIDIQIADAERQGDTIRAERLRSAKTSLMQMRIDKANGIGMTAEAVIGIREKINDLFTAGLQRDDPIIQTLEGQMAEFTKSEASVGRANRLGDAPKTERIADASNAPLPDPEDLD